MLVKVTCCAVLAFIAGFTYHEITKERQARLVASASEERRFCRALVKHEITVDSDVLSREIQKCMFKGYVTMSDMP